jgi:ABC-type Fe3+-hydroxamate transport system substrate-binding protein
MEGRVDSLGRTCGAPASPRRIVSLVPSLTELLFALEVGDRVVGKTDYCIHPRDALAALPTVGGQKDPDLDALVALRPELVIVAKEENLKRDVERLEQAGVPVFVTDVRTIEDGLRLPDVIGALCDAPPASIRQLADAMRAGVAAASRIAAGQPRRRGFCAVWKDPWIGANRDTYLQSVLQLCGVDDLCLDEARRYPKVVLEDVLARAPDVVLLPSEPYPFDARDVTSLQPRVAEVRLIDGTLACWYGPRMARLPELAESLRGS